MKIHLAFYCFDESDDFPVPLSYHRDRPFPAPHAQWKPLADLVSQVAHKYGVDTIERHVPSDDLPCILVLLADTWRLTRLSTLNNLVATNTDNPETKEKRLRFSFKQTLPDDPNNYPDFEYIRRMRPILTIGLEDINYLFAEKTLNASLLYSRRYLYDLHFDPRVKFWDSSIWHRYLPLNEHFVSSLELIITKIKTWYEYGLYDTYVALESLELQTRAMLNSYVCEFNDNSHGRVVTPFKFHAESAMRQEADALWNSLRQFCVVDNAVANGDNPDSGSNAGVIQWRMLLVDDYASQSLRSYHTNIREKLFSAIISKRNLIYNIIHQNVPGYRPLQGESEDEPDVWVFAITDLGKIKYNVRKEARIRLLKKMYDVILLDYLLGEGEESRTDREYGYDFLQDLQGIKPEDESETSFSHKSYKKGPLEHFWVLPISSFPFAFSDKLRQLGLEGQTNHWLLSGGGDPITTPELFRYNFFHFIQQQINELYLTPEAIYNLLMRYAGVQSGKLWRELVLNALDSLSLQRMILEYDEDQGSLFAKTILSYIRNNEQHKKLLVGIKSFVKNIAEIPYFKLETALLEIGDTDQAIIHLLREKSSLFFQAETSFYEEINKPDLPAKLEYDGKRLRWLPDKLELLNTKGVTELRLSNNNLTLLPESITQLTGLIKLDLSHNDIQCLPRNLESLKHLEYLDLTGNKSLPSYLQTKHEGRDAIRSLFLKSSTWNTERAKKVMICYAREDKAGLDELCKILKLFERENLIELWTDEDMPAGAEWDGQLQHQLMQADFILLLVSADFLASDYINDVELKIAMDRVEKKECVIIPIIYRDCNWKDCLGKYAAIPTDDSPIAGSRWHSSDEAWTMVGKRLRKSFQSYK